MLGRCIHRVSPRVKRLRWDVIGISETHWTSLQNVMYMFTKCKVTSIGQESL